MSNIRFTTWEQSLTPEEIERVEIKLSTSFPDTMKKLYMTHNGGSLEDTFIFAPRLNENIDVYKFVPIRYIKKFKNDPNWTLEAIVMDEWKIPNFPSNLLMFATTFCTRGSFYLNRDTQEIYYFDKWSDDKLPIWVASSFDDFLSKLVYIENTKKEESRTEKRVKQPKLTFEDCGQKLTKADIQAIETKLGVTLSNELKKLYLKFNGGMPNRTMYYGIAYKGENYSGDDLEGIEVSMFLPMIQSDATNTRFEDENILSWVNNKIPKYYIAFAIDHGSNAICQNINDEKIYFLVRDVWRENLSDNDNFEINSFLVADSLNQFIKLLVLSDKDDDE